MSLKINTLRYEGDSAPADDSSAVALVSDEGGRLRISFRNDLSREQLNDISEAMKLAADAQIKRNFNDKAN